MSLSGARTRVAVVTGASSGIGEIAALRLAEAGCHVVMLGRNPDRSRVAFERIRAAVPTAQVTLVLADLSSMAHVIRAADEIISACVDHVDILVNNAGAIHRTRQMTPENLEGTFAGNYLGPFVLTLRLLPLLRAAGRARVINVSSVGHTMIRDMMWDDLQMSHAFDGSRAYFQSKLGNILFTKELSRRVKSDGIVVNAMHPGMVASSFPRTGDWKTKVAYALSRPFQSTVEAILGIRYILHLGIHQRHDSAITGKRKRTHGSP